MTQDEFPDDLIRHCEQQALEAVASDTAGLVRAVLRASEHAELVAALEDERDRGARFRSVIDIANREVSALRAQNAELVTAARGRGMSAAEELHNRGVRIEVLRAQNAELVAALVEIEKNDRRAYEMAAIARATLANAGVKP
jgi:hypothetical protein